MDSLDDGVLAFKWDINVTDCYGDELYPSVIIMYSRTYGESALRLIKMSVIENSPIPLHPQLNNMMMTEVYKDGKVYER